MVKIKLLEDEDLEIEITAVPSILSIRFIEHPEEIVKWLQIGTRIPIWPEFYPYILNDLKMFQSKSLLLIKGINIVGHVLVYHENTDILYFGFFGIIDHNSEKIEFLLDKLIEFAKQNNFKKIVGPINIPIVIYGWGFMEENSDATLYIAKPINPPIYQELFLQKGFVIKTKELSLEGQLQKFDKKILSKYDSENYEFYHPENWEDVENFKPLFFKLNANLPSESVITPGRQYLYDNYMKFIKQYGGLFLITYLKYIPMNQIVGCFISIPNPFAKDENGTYNSFMAFLILIDKEHQKEGLGGLLTLYSFNEAFENQIIYTASPVESKLKPSIKLGEKFGLKPKRAFLILEYTI